MSHHSISSYTVKHRHLNLYSPHLALRRCTQIPEASRSWQESNDVSSHSWLTFQEPELQAFCKEHKDVPPPQDVLLTPPSTEPSALHCTWAIRITTANTRFSSSSPFSETRQPQKQCSCLCIPHTSHSAMQHICKLGKRVYFKRISSGIQEVCMDCLHFLSSPEGITVHKVSLQ